MLVSEEAHVHITASDNWRRESHGKQLIHRDLPARHLVVSILTTPALPSSNQHVTNEVALVATKPFPRQPNSHSISMPPHFQSAVAFRSNYSATATSNGRGPTTDEVRLVQRPYLRCPARPQELCISCLLLLLRLFVYRGLGEKKSQCLTSHCVFCGPTADYLDVSSFGYAKPLQAEIWQTWTERSGGAPYSSRRRYLGIWGIDIYKEAGEVSLK